ncbi:MAG: hypothetical protein ACK41G_11915 [Candidatus Thermochlorobacter sp.]
MKYNGVAFHQGDVQIYGVKSLPENAKKIRKSFFAKSEKSGHVHALCGNYELFEDPEVPGSFYVRVYGEGAVLNHTHGSRLNEPMFFDKLCLTEVADHKPTFFKPGIYRVGIQRRVDPYAGVWRRLYD